MEIEQEGGANRFQPWVTIHLPAPEQACQAARRDIMQANSTIEEMPRRIQLASEQLKLVKDREARTRQLDRLLDDENSLHGVLQRSTTSRA